MKNKLILYESMCGLFLILCLFFLFGVKNEIKYNMAPIYKSYNEYEDITKLWFTIEIKEAACNFGEELKVRINDTEISSIKVWDGYVCANNHMENEYDIHDEDHVDCPVRTILIEYPGNIDFTDLNVISNIYLKNNIIKNKTLQFEFNAEISDITTNQNYLHGNTIFEINGKYYILNSENNEIKGSSYKSYYKMRIECINGTVEELYLDLKDNSELIYKQNYEKLYSKEIEKSNSKLYFDFEKDGLLIGLINANHLELNEYEINLSRNILLKYIYNDENFMIFCID